MRAWALHVKGWSNARIAAAVGVSATAVGLWIKAAEAGGAESLRSRPRAGRVARLSDAQIRLLLPLLERGPEASGFVGPIWTWSRIAQVIERSCGVRHHPAHLGRVLQRYGWRYQEPTVGVRGPPRESLRRRGR